MITIEQFSGIVKIKNAEIILKAFNDTCEKYEINTRNRTCHFLAQLLHESGCFRYSKELATGIAYEFRKDLGNIRPGWGQKYKGRGYIQITGRYNYEQLSKDLQIDFTKNPEYLEQLPYSMISAGWFWNRNKLNRLADKNQVTAITLTINGGTNGIEDRKKWLIKCFENIS
jgi:putative chitinase